MICRFLPCEPKEWTGRYDRIPGDSSVFHLRWRWDWGCFWPMAEGKCGSEKAFYWFENKKAVRDLANSVARVQLRFNGREGGSFTINEWGQVIVPSGEGDRRRYLAGVLRGSWSLVAPDDVNGRVSLEDDDGLECGDPWDRPYVGLPYHLSKRGYIYFVHRSPGKDVLRYPPYQDTDLINAIREIRPWGAVKFIVNSFGLVLTKRPSRGQLNEENWDPVYVGRIDYERWFENELVSQPVRTRDKKRDSDLTEERKRSILPLLNLLEYIVRDRTQLDSITGDQNQSDSILRGLTELASTLRDPSKLASILRDPDRFEFCLNVLTQLTLYLRDANSLTSILLKVYELISICRGLNELDSGSS